MEHIDSGFEDFYSKFHKENTPAPSSTSREELAPMNFTLEGKRLKAELDLIDTDFGALLKKYSLH